MPANYVKKPDTYDFITWDGTNEDDVADFMVAIFGADSISYVVKQNILHLNVAADYSSPELDRIFRIPNGRAIAMRSTVEEGHEAVDLVEVVLPSALLPYTDVYVTP